MFRIDNNTALSAMPVAAAPLTPGYFTDGNPGTGLPATIVDAWWCNMLQEEILTVVTAAGLAANKADNTQLLQALDDRYGAGAGGPFLPLVGGTLANPGNLLSSGGAITSRGAYASAPTGFYAGGSSGTPTAPLPLQNGQIVGRYVFFGYGATGWNSGLLAQARVEAQATENWSDTAQGCDLHFLGTATGSLATTSSQAVLQLNGSTGNLSLLAGSLTQTHPPGIRLLPAGGTTNDIWSVTASNTGNFIVTDETQSVARMTIDVSGVLRIGTPAQVTVSPGLTVGAPTPAIPGGIQAGDIHCQRLFVNGVQVTVP